MGLVWRGMDRLGWAWRGKAWQGPRWGNGLELAGRGEAGYGSAGQGVARRGKAWRGPQWGIFNKGDATLFQKHKRTDEQIASIMAILSTYNRGDVVPHGEIATASGLTAGTHRYYQIVRRARDLYCESTGVWTREVNSVGYRLLTPEQSLVEEQSFRRKRMRRQSNIGKAVAESLPAEALSDHQKRLRAHVLESHAAARKALLQDERHELWLLKPPSDRPVRTVPPRTGTS